jgi:hypothetical protein
MMLSLLTEVFCVLKLRTQRGRGLLQWRWRFLRHAGSHRQDKIVSKPVRPQKLPHTNKQTNERASKRNSFWHYRLPLLFPQKVKATLACKVHQNAYEGQTRLGWKYLRTWPCDTRHGPETRRHMFIPGRFMLSTQTNDLTCWLCYRPSDVLYFPVTAVLKSVIFSRLLANSCAFRQTN